MPAINVTPTRQAARGPHDFTSSGGMNPPCGNCLRQFYGANAPSPLRGAPLTECPVSRKGGCSGACH